MAAFAFLTSGGEDFESVLVGIPIQQYTMYLGQKCKQLTGLFSNREMVLDSESMTQWPVPVCS